MFCVFHEEWDGLIYIYIFEISAGLDGLGRDLVNDINKRK